MTEPSRPSPASERGRVARAWWMGLGFASVGVGSVGIVVPGLPTTVFFIMAAWCFGRSSPRFERWVLDLPKVGPLVRDHRAGLGMPRRAKVTAIGTMWAAIVVSALLVRGNLLVAGLIVALGVAGTAYLGWKVPTRDVRMVSDTIRTPAALSRRRSARRPPRTGRRSSHS